MSETRVRHTMNVKVTAVIQSTSSPVDYALMSERVGRNSSVSDVMMAVGHQLQSHLDALHDNELPGHPSIHPQTRSITIELLEDSAKPKTEKMYLVCNGCGEAFDDITAAHEHGASDSSGMAGWCGDEGFVLQPESEAM